MCNGLEQPRKQQRSDLNGPVDNNNTPEVGTLGHSAACLPVVRLPQGKAGTELSAFSLSHTHTHLGSVSFPELTVNTMSACSEKPLNYTHEFVAATFILGDCPRHVLTPKIF